MTGTNCDMFTHKSSRSYLNHLVHKTQTISVVGLYVLVRAVTWGRVGRVASRSCCFESNLQSYRNVNRHFSKSPDFPMCHWLSLSVGAWDQAFNLNSLLLPGDQWLLSLSLSLSLESARVPFEGTGELVRSLRISYIMSSVKVNQIFLRPSAALGHRKGVVTVICKGWQSVGEICSVLFSDFVF